MHIDEPYSNVALLNADDEYQMLRNRSQDYKIYIVPGLSCILQSYLGRINHSRWWLELSPHEIAHIFNWFSKETTLTAIGTYGPKVGTSIAGSHSPSTPCDCWDWLGLQDTNVFFANLTPISRTSMIMMVKEGSVSLKISAPSSVDRINQDIVSPIFLSTIPKKLTY